MIKVSTLMSKVKRVAGPKFETTALLEDVLTTLNQSKTDTGAVIDGKGKVIGKITMKDAIMAMARPKRSQTGARYK